MLWLLALGAVLALGTLACAGGSPSIRAETVTAPTAFSSAEDAVRSVAESQGAAYAGDCAATAYSERQDSISARERGACRGKLASRASERTRPGWASASSCPAAPPSERPTTWARSISQASRTRSASSAS